MLVSVSHTLARRSRAGFTLIEVLVVVAIIVILAGVGGVALIGYIEEARIDAARVQMTNFENAARNYMAKHEGEPPQTLNELVAPTDGVSKPLVEGGTAILNPPIKGARYEYDANFLDVNGSPDPKVTLILSDGTTYNSNRRR